MYEVFDDVIVGQDQPGRRNKRAGAAVIKTHRRHLHFLEPGVRYVKAVLALDLSPRHVVERPHALVRESRDV